MVGLEGSGRKGRQPDGGGIISGSQTPSLPGT